VIEHLAVVIPASSEAAALPACLASLARAREAVGSGVTVECVVVADDCTDGTAAMARASSSGRLPVTVVEIGARSVGTADS